MRAIKRPVTFVVPHAALVDPAPPRPQMHRFAIRVGVHGVEPIVCRRRPGAAALLARLVADGDGTLVGRDEARPVAFAFRPMLAQPHSFVGARPEVLVSQAGMRGIVARGWRPPVAAVLGEELGPLRGDSFGVHNVRVLVVVCARLVAKAPAFVRIKARHFKQRARGPRRHQNLGRLPWFSVMLEQNPYLRGPRTAIRGGTESTNTAVGCPLHHQVHSRTGFGTPETGTGPGSIPGAAGAVVKLMVALYEEAVKAALPVVARLPLLPGGDVVLDCAPRNADVFTELDSALLAQAPPLSISAGGQVCFFPGECPREVVKVTSTAMNGREALDGPFSKFARREIVGTAVKVIQKLGAAVRQALDRDIKALLDPAHAAHSIRLQPPP